MYGSNFYPNTKRRSTKCCMPETTATEYRIFSLLHNIIKSTAADVSLLWGIFRCPSNRFLSIGLRPDFLMSIATDSLIKKISVSIFSAGLLLARKSCGWNHFSSSLWLWNLKNRSLLRASCAALPATRFGSCRVKADEPARKRKGAAGKLTATQCK